MATQFGVLARLTWWEYSWDIMEPVTYFITYGTAMAMYAYFVLTRQVRDHQATKKLVNRTQMALSVFKSYSYKGVSALYSKDHIVKYK